MDDTTDGPSAEQTTDHHTLRLEARVGDRDQFVFHTVPALTSPKAFRQSELLLLDTLHGDPPNALLVPQANYGVVGIVMGSFVERVWMTETSANAVRCCRHNIQDNGAAPSCDVALTTDLQALPGSFDAAAYAPRGYTPAEVVEQRMADALAVLDSTGRFYLAATPRTGLRRYERKLKDLCADVEIVDQRDDCSVLRGTRSESLCPARIAESRNIQPTIDGITLTLVTYPGLFSASKLDDGSRALAKWLEASDGERLLDLACGYGPLGIHAARSADCTVTLTDDNCVATTCARTSATLSQVEDRVEVVTADGVAGVHGRTFDRVSCNPPTHAGSPILHKLMRGARDALTADGVLQLVHHRGVSFDQFLTPSFEVVSSVERGDYRLIAAQPLA